MVGAAAAIGCVQKNTAKKSCAASSRLSSFLHRYTLAKHRAFKKQTPCSAPATRGVLERLTALSFSVALCPAYARLALGFTARECAGGNCGGWVQLFRSGNLESVGARRR